MSRISRIFSPSGSSRSFSLSSGVRIFPQRRVVVTGMGVVTPLGLHVNTVWNRLINGESGIDSITLCDVSNIGCKIAGQVVRGNESQEVLDQEEVFIRSKWITKKDYKSQSQDYIAFAMRAATKALEDAQWKPETPEEKARTGVAFGSGNVCQDAMVETGLHIRDKKFNRVSPFFIPRILINLAGGHISVLHGLEGPNHSCTTACATGSHSIGDAYRMIQRGDADVMVAGGSETSINPAILQSFYKAKALCSKYNDNPKEASRPFDADRCGFVMSEGAGALILEEYEHARKRGAKIYAEIRGYGMSGDAHHLTSPREDGDGAYRAMKMAIEQSGIEIDQFDYINAHGTSTPLGDKAENAAIKRLFGKHAYELAISSTKGSLGHMLGAAGAVEAILCVKAMHEKTAPPTINLHNRTAEFDLNYVPLEAQKRKRIDAVLSNSFGFGGNNAAICFARIEE